MFTCRRCGEEKDESEFHRSRALKRGFLPRCKACIKDLQRKARPSLTAYMRKWRALNREKVNSYAKERRAKNLADRMANNAKRRAVTKQATPPWANRFFIREAYALAKLRTELTGVKWEVDHIVPLRASTVCGLNAHTNLRVVTKTENLKKRHYSWPDKP